MSIIHYIFFSAFKLTSTIFIFIYLVYKIFGTNTKLHTTNSKQEVQIFRFDTLLAIFIPCQCTRNTFLWPFPVASPKSNLLYLLSRPVTDPPTAADNRKHNYIVTPWSSLSGPSIRHDSVLNRIIISIIFQYLHFPPPTPSGASASPLAHKQVSFES